MPLILFFTLIFVFCAMTCYTLATVREKSSLLMVLSVNVLRIRLKISSKKSRIKVWSVSQKAVLLHPLSIRKATRTE